jgi:uncharacterized membrane protein (Fun14 family)
MMWMPEADTEQNKNEAPNQSPISVVPTWGKVLIVFAVLLMVVGIAAPWFGGIGGGSGGQTLAMGSPIGGAGALEDLPDFSPAVFRLGFSFAIAFAIAYAFRMFMRTVLIFAGLFALMLAGLEYAGLIEVKWGAMASGYESAASWFSAQTQSMMAFATGYLPSLGAGTLGLGAGFVRR